METAEAIVFDLEGTLFHSPRLSQEHLIAIASLIARERTISLIEATNLLHTTRHRLSKQVGYKPTMVATVSFLGIDRIDFYSCIESVDAAPYVQPNLPLARILEKIGQKYKVGLLTNVSWRTAFNVLCALNLDMNQFDAVVTGDRVCETKPAPEPFITMVGLLKTQPNRIIMVGDRIYIDLLPAKKLGMKTILIGKKNGKNSLVDFAVDEITAISKIILHKMT